MFNRSTKEKKEKMRSEGNKIELYNEDCIKTMERISDESIDLILQDPPYGTTSIHWDKAPDFNIMWKHWLRIIKPNGAIIMTASQPFTTDVINSKRDLFRYELIWEKSKCGSHQLANKMPLKQHENILVFYKKLPTYNPQKTKAPEYLIDKRKTFTNQEIKNGMKHMSSGILIQRKDDGWRFPVSVLKFNNSDRTDRIHPTEKPVDLLRWIIKTFTNEGEIVFDGYSGSGSCAIACELENRNFIGAELNEEYYIKSLKRIENEVSQTKLF